MQTGGDSFVEKNITVTQTYLSRMLLSWNALHFSVIQGPTLHNIFPGGILSMVNIFTYSLRIQEPRNQESRLSGLQKKYFESVYY